LGGCGLPGLRPTRDGGTRNKADQAHEEPPAGRDMTAPTRITLLGEISREGRRIATGAHPAVRDPLIQYAVGLWISVVGVASALVVLGERLEEPIALAFLALVALVAERGTVRLSANSSIEHSISLLPVLFAAVLFGPASAMVVAAVSMLADVHGHPERPYLRWSIYTCTRAITGAATGAVAAAGVSLVSSDLAALTLAALLGALVAEGLDALFAAFTFRVRGSGAMREVFAALAPTVPASVPLYAPVVALLAYAYTVSPWTLPLFFVPALAAQRLFVLYQGQRELTEDLVSANQRLESANLSFASALVATLDARDEYTAGHSATVAIYARDIAARMGLPPETQQLAHLCGLVHDMGKIGLPAGLLEKPGPLTLEERRQMERHSEIGERILANVDDYAEIANIVRHHHERFDGNGYPDRLEGNAIPVISRILAVADAYDAMTSDRPYRLAMPHRVARMRLAQAVGSQFDTGVVAAFEAILATADDAYRTSSPEPSAWFNEWRQVRLAAVAS
jgi:putative nucleotidyltransferase with HDIG domain